MNYKKILILGSNNEGTNDIVDQLVQFYNLPNLGIITSDTQSINVNGIYHTTVVDLPIGSIITLAKHFDLVRMLDQPRDQWTHIKILKSTYKLMLDLEGLQIPVEFRLNQNVQSLEKIETMVTDNKSWCIYPWINFISRSGTELNLCARSSTVVANEVSTTAWQNSSVRKTIQEKMKNNQLIPESCSYCYKYEDLGIESYRQYESKEWLNWLGIDEFDKLPTSPKYYELHFGNLCNIKCRSCEPLRSSAIDKEFKRHKIIMPSQLLNIVDKFSTVDAIDFSSLDKYSRVYISGGEPVIMPETLEFMRKCIEHNRVEFELTMSTNGVKLPEEFVNLLPHFKNVNFNFSIDGYGTINDYWRSGSSWQKIVDNMHRMQDLGHQVHINTVPGIYNVTNLHLLLEWIDIEFPHATLYMQINYLGEQSAYNHPNHKAVLESMKRCQATNVYWSDGKSCKTSIDSIYNHYKNNPTCNLDSLKNFFEFNDKLDEIRKIKLADYIPELDDCRKLIPPAKIN
jgi:sulfatase maturation enzyme AslB (radical SAM superfamily)